MNELPSKAIQDGVRESALEQMRPLLRTVYGEDEQAIEYTLRAIRNIARATGNLMCVGCYPEVQQIGVAHSIAADDWEQAAVIVERVQQCDLGFSGLELAAYYSARELMMLAADLDEPGPVPEVEVIEFIYALGESEREDAIKAASKMDENLTFRINNAEKNGEAESVIAPLRARRDAWDEVYLALRKGCALDELPIDQIPHFAQYLSDSEVTFPSKGGRRRNVQIKRIPNLHNVIEVIGKCAFLSGS